MKKSEMDAATASRDGKVHNSGIGDKRYKLSDNAAAAILRYLAGRS